MDFLKQIGLIDINNLNLSSVQFLKTATEGLTSGDRSSADFAYLLFEQKINGYPIISNAPGIGTVNVRINRDNKVVAFDMTLVNYSIQSNTNYQIKSFDELVSSLPQAKIQNLDSSFSSLISKVTITDAKISYLREYSTNQTILQPIFVLTGTTGSNDSSQGTPVILYLPAISGQYLNPVPSGI